MAKVGRALMWLVAGLVADLVCSVLTIAQFLPIPVGTALDVSTNVLQVFATGLVIVGLYCLQPLSRHFALSFWWRVAQFVAYLALVVLAALPISLAPAGPSGEEGLAFSAAFTLVSVAVSCTLSLLANREMLRGTYVALDLLGAPKGTQERARSTSTLVAVSSSTLVAALLASALLVVRLGAHEASPGVPLVVGGLFAIVLLAGSIVFVLVVDALVIACVQTLRAIFSEVIE